MADFLTISSPSEGIYKEKGSKFIAYAYPVISEDEVRTYVKALKKEYYDARHHCYAFVLGKDKIKFRAADDGEPSNSAGAPILGQLRSLELTNVLVVVVRYFGGTKLGVPGLIDAYREAAKDALSQAQIIGEFEQTIFDIQFEYIKMNDVMKIVKDAKLKVVKQQFDNNCEMTLQCNTSDADQPLHQLREMNVLLED
ncbi:YigZ family protein [Cyclobacteriaceae bacterium]|nr:YigZ family protein [Cyclobacteriaceae bacterium]